MRRFYVVPVTNASINYSIITPP